MPLCSVSLPLFPIRGKACFPSSWIWTGLLTSFGQEKVAEVIFFEFQSLGLKRPWSFCFCRLGGLGLHGSPVILIARPFEERVREREREKEREKKRVRKRERNPTDWKMSKRGPGEWKTKERDSSISAIQPRGQRWVRPSWILQPKLKLLSELSPHHMERRQVILAEACWDNPWTHKQIHNYCLRH